MLADTVYRLGYYTHRQVVPTCVRRHFKHSLNFTIGFSLTQGLTRVKSEKQPNNCSALVRMKKLIPTVGTGMATPIIAAVRKQVVDGGVDQ